MINITPITSDVTVGGSATFAELPALSDEYTLEAKIYKVEGDIGNEYRPFHNMQGDDGMLKEFRTKKLNFDLRYPVDLTVQPSYDGSVNVILNDDKNPPRLINSRFSLKENKKYKIVDRKGNNDTNIYKEDAIDINTRLFKTLNKIPFIEFLGLSEGGQLKAGSYTFFFKYTDDDANESDFISESGKIVCHIGGINTPHSIKSGIGNEKTNKIINLKLKNIDTDFSHLSIYGIRESSDYDGNTILNPFKIDGKKLISNIEMDFSITGFESFIDMSVDEFNKVYNIVNKVKTQSQVQNMLFFANVDKPKIDYNELSDLMLRVYPSIVSEDNIGLLDESYGEKAVNNNFKSCGYFDSKNIYYYTGYWNKEIYRFGAYLIMRDDTISPVFDIRGRDRLDYINPSSSSDYKNYIQKLYTYHPVNDTNGNRVKISYDNDGFISQSNLENAKGVVRVLSSQKQIDTHGSNPGVFPIGIKFNIEDDVINELKKYAKGIVFVRQDRIPTIISQGLSTATDNLSHTPLLYAKLNNSSENEYITESFMASSKELTHSFSQRVIKSTSNTCNALICPDAVSRPYLYSELFTGSLYNVSESTITPSDVFLSQKKDNDRHFYMNRYSSTLNNNIFKDIKMTMVNTGTPVRYSGSKYFSSKAGIPEEISQFECLSKEDKTSNATNLLRGDFLTFIGAEGLSNSNKMYDIHIQGYNIDNMKNYFLNRFTTLTPYKTISDRIDFDAMSKNMYNNISNVFKGKAFKCFRGDCYISPFTTRVMMNFQDPDTPINDKILDSNTWRNNYKGYLANGAVDSENISKINRSDINAVNIGHWVTFYVASDLNHCIRSTDERNSNEFAIFGSHRGFYPYYTMNPASTGKIRESEAINYGVSKSLSEKYYLSLPDVPYIKDEFANRIMYSEISVDDSFKNGYRVFNGMAYQDVTSQYGFITKVLELNSNLLIVFENGVGLMSVNERALLQGTEDVFIGAGKVIDKNIRILSDSYGSAWEDSIVKTNRGYIYGFDAEARKLWRTNGEAFEVISDYKIQKFLNDNTNLKEREKFPNIPERNIKTHYDSYNNDVIFTFYNYELDNSKDWAIVYNEDLDKFVTRLSWHPMMSDNINNIFISNDLKYVRENMKNPNRIVYFYKHGLAGIFNNLDKPSHCTWYDKNEPFEFEFIVNDNPSVHKVFDNMKIISNNAEPESFTYEVYGDSYSFRGEKDSTQEGLPLIVSGSTILSTSIAEEYVRTTQKCVDIKKNGIRLGNSEYKEDKWLVQMPMHRFKARLDGRIRDKYLKIRVRYTGSNNAIIASIINTYTTSYA